MCRSKSSDSLNGLIMRKFSAQTLMISAEDALNGIIPRIIKLNDTSTLLHIGCQLEREKAANLLPCNQLIHFITALLSKNSTFICNVLLLVCFVIENTQFSGGKSPC